MPRRTSPLPSSVVTILAAVALVGVAPAQKHPHFDDGGALAWQTTMADAKQAAAAANRMILLEYGRAT